MTEARLQEMLHESAERITISPPPLAVIARGVRRRRAGAVGLAAVVLVGGAAVAVPHIAGRGHEVGPAGQASGGTGHESARRYSADEVPVFLPVSGFEVGTDHLEGRALTTTTGVLIATNDDQCLVVGDDETPVFWPYGYEGLTHDDHGFSLLDERGEVVAEVGDTVRLRGIWRPPAHWSGDEECNPEDRRSFMVTARPDVIN
jgi:hypothetical protein